MGRNQPESLDNQLTRGEQVYHFLEYSYGQDYAWEYAMVKYPRRKGPVSERSETREDDLPRGFWHDYVKVDTCTKVATLSYDLSGVRLLSYLLRIT